jgi:hypothetical protein
MLTNTSATADNFIIWMRGNYEHVHNRISDMTNGLQLGNLPGSQARFCGLNLCNFTGHSSQIKNDALPE